MEATIRPIREVLPHPGCVEQSLSRGSLKRLDWSVGAEEEEWFSRMVWSTAF